jgi:imidazolonepropionase-like amidohydrolase
MAISTLVVRGVAAVVLLTAVPFAARADETRSLEYSVLSAGHPAGAETDKFGPGGTLEATFEYNDRGRGPKVKASYVFGADGLPTRVDVTGVNYLKANVDEHFTLTDAGGSWHSESEQGQLPGRAFYISNDGVGATELAALVRALSHAPGGKVGLFPGGEARVEFIAEATVESHGSKMHVREAAISGLDFVPSSVWIDDSGDLFAVPGSWFAILRSGWESTNETLFKLQSDADDARFHRLAHELSRHPSHPLAFEHVRVFDSENARELVDQTVIVDGHQIAAIGPAGSVQVPAEAERVDGRGRTLLPGLFDMHMHVQGSDGLLNIASGVTAGRDVGNDIERLGRIQQQWDSGDSIGPKFWKAGLIDGPGPFQAPTGIFVSTPAEAEAAVNKYADLGYVQIKLYSSLKPELVPGIAAVAHRRGLRLSGHTPNGMLPADFVREGADELQHINFIFLNFLADKVKDTRTPERFTAVAEYGGSLDLESAAVHDFIQLLLAHHTTLDVTLATFESMFTGRPGRVSSDCAPVVERLPAQVQRQCYAGGLAVTAATDQRNRDSYAAMLRMTKKLSDAGVPILVGTDAMAGVMLHRELELEVKAGISPAKALQNATWLAATVLKQQATMGAIRPGSRADLLLVEGNPLVSISDIRRGRMVVKDGTVFDPAKVYAAVGMLPSR